MTTRTHYGAEQWKEWILECRNSGLSIKEWCECHNLRDNLFFRWRRRLIDRGELDEFLYKKEEAKSSGGNPVLPQVVQVNLHASPSLAGSAPNRENFPADNIISSRIMIETPINGCHIFVGTGFSQDTLRKVLEVVI